jgi:hypothetical protein
LNKTIIKLNLKINNDTNLTRGGSIIGGLLIVWARRVTWCGWPASDCLYYQLRPTHVAKGARTRSALMELFFQIQHESQSCLIN